MSILTDTYATTATVLADDRWDGPGAWWPIFPILWLIVIGTAIFLLVRFGRRNARMAGTRAGEARLAELYAAGEITEDEYRHRLTVLKEQQS